MSKKTTKKQRLPYYMAFPQPKFEQPGQLITDNYDIFKSDAGDIENDGAKRGDGMFKLCHKNGRHICQHDSHEVLFFVGMVLNSEDARRA